MKTEYQNWQVWGKTPEVEGTLTQRAKGELPEMESTKQLVNLLKEVYRPGMCVLDAGCNVGHYYQGLKRLDPAIQYTGVDAYRSYIDQAKKIYQNEKNATFKIWDVMTPPSFPEPFDIVYCCNVILHLPFFKTPVKHLLEASKRYVFIRTLIGEHTTMVRRSYDNVFDDAGNPLNFVYQNTYQQSFFTDYIQQFGYKVEMIDDQFNSEILDQEHSHLKKGHGTRIFGGRQVDANIIFNWKFIKITKS